MRVKFLAAGLALALGLSACGSSDNSSGDPSSSGAPIKITIAQAGDFLGWSSLYVAQQKGYFKDNGLDVNIVKASGGPQVMAAVLAGQAQFSTSTVGEIFSAWAQGQQVRVVTPFAHQSNILCVIRPDVLQRIGVSPTAGWEEKARGLKGLKIGVPSTGGSTALTAKYMMKNAGLDPERDVQMVALGVDIAASVAAMQRNQLDAVCSGIPIPEAIIAAGAAVEYLGPAKGEVPAMDGITDQTLSATANYIKDNPEAIRRLVKSIAAAQDFIKKSPAEAGTIVKQAGFAALDQKAFDAGFKDIGYGLNSCPIMTQKSFDVAKEFYTFALGKPIPVTFDQVYDPAFAQGLSCQAD